MYNKNFCKANHQLKKIAAEAEAAYEQQLLSRLSAPIPSRDLPSTPAWREDWENYDNYEANTDGRGNLSLSARLTTPLCDTSREPPVSLGDSDMDVEDGIDHQAAFDDYLGSESDEYELNHMIETAAGLSEKARGKQRERQVPHLCNELTLTSTSSQCTK